MVVVRREWFPFYDGDTDCSTRSDEPSLLHFCHHCIMDVEERRQKCWNKILEEKIIIPANNIKVFHSDGNLAGKMVYTLGDVTYEPHSTILMSAFPTLEYHPLIQEGNSYSRRQLSHSRSLLSHSRRLLSHSRKQLSHSRPEVSSHTHESSSHTPEVSSHTHNSSSHNHEGSSHTHKGSSHTHESSSHTRDDYQGHSLGEGHTDSSSSYIHLIVQPTDTGMKTTLAGSISSILHSDNTELKQFDELRFSLKRKKGKFVT